ncbi:unnamed protein product, partial [marine sediment metagenome]
LMEMGFTISQPPTDQDSHNVKALLDCADHRDVEGGIVIADSFTKQAVLLLQRELLSVGKYRVLGDTYM